MLWPRPLLTPPPGVPPGWASGSPAQCAGLHGCLVPAPESEDEYSDDDDMSWKVRRAAAKCLAALIGSRPDLLHDFHCTLAPVLIRRFKEREENVKADVFGAYIVLLRQTRPPKGWLEGVEEPTQTGSNLHILRGQVCLPAPPSCSLPLPAPPSFIFPASHPPPIHPLKCTYGAPAVGPAVCTKCQDTASEVPIPGQHCLRADRQ